MGHDSEAFVVCILFLLLRLFRLNGLICKGNKGINAFPGISGALGLGTSIRWFRMRCGCANISMAPADIVFGRIAFAVRDTF